MRIVLLADVGGSDGYHAGDEAMLDAAIDQLQRRGDPDITVISAEPAATSKRYSVGAVGRIQFADRSAQAAGRQDRRLAAVLALGESRDGARRGAEEELEATGGPGGAGAVVETIAGADALIIAGGGNLSSTWPEHLYERVAAMTLARRHRVPIVVTSQTIGPALSSRERSLLAESLGAVRLLGLREQASLRLAADLLPPSTPRRLPFDDAVGLPDADVPSFAGDDRIGDGFVALTVNPLGDGPKALAALDGLVTLIRHIHERTGLTIAFLPHFGRWEGPASGDVAVGEWLVDRLGQDRELVVCPLLPARQLASLTRRATAIVSTRYHPIVFGLAAAVPCLAVYQDQYTSTKLVGALAHAGLPKWRLPVESLVTDLPGEVFDELWSRRDELTEHLQAVTAPWEGLQDQHWDEVWEAVTRPARALAVEGRTVGLAPPEVEPKLAGLLALNGVTDGHHSEMAASVAERQVASIEVEQQTADLRDALLARVAESEGLRSHLDDVRREGEIAARARALAVASADVDGLHARVADVDLLRATVEASNIQLLDELRVAERSARAARRLVMQSRRRIDIADARLAATAAALAEIEALREELQTRLATISAQADEQRTLIAAIYATRTMRWSHGPREVYRRLRLEPFARLAALRRR